MKLRDYLYEKRIQITEFARIIDYQRTSLNAVMLGIKKPGRKMMERIERETEGKVTAEDLLMEYKENALTRTK